MGSGASIESDQQKQTQAQTATHRSPSQEYHKHSSAELSHASVHNQHASQAARHHSSHSYNPNASNRVGPASGSGSSHNLGGSAGSLTGSNRISKSSHLYETKLDDEMNVLPRRSSRAPSLPRIDEAGKRMAADANATNPHTSHAAITPIQQASLGVSGNGARPTHVTGHTDNKNGSRSDTDAFLASIEDEAFKQNETLIGRKLSIKRTSNENLAHHYRSNSHQQQQQSQQQQQQHAGGTQTLGTGHLVASHPPHSSHSSYYETEEVQYRPQKFDKEKFKRANKEKRNDVHGSDKGMDAMSPLTSGSNLTLDAANGQAGMVGVPKGVFLDDTDEDLMNEIIGTS